MREEMYTPREKSVVAKDVSYTLPNGEVLFEKVELAINKGDRIALVGKNGTGKSTLMKILVGEIKPSSGSVDKANVAYVDQLDEGVDERTNRSLMEYIGSVTEDWWLVQLHYEKMFGQEIPELTRNLMELSGGEYMRLKLAVATYKQPEILLLDEPTNHLDVESIEWLEEWIKGYEAPLLMTSHDREFMNRIVNRIVDVSGKSLVNYTGNYDYYEKESVIRREQLLSSHKKQQDMLAKEEEFIARFAARASHAAQVQSRVKKLDKIDRIEIPAEEQVMHFNFSVAPRSGDDVVSLKDLSKVWVTDDGREKPVFSGITGMVRRLEKVAVTGVNGAGKSTLLKVITGQTEATSGEAVIGASVKMGYFSQHSLEVLNPNNTIFEEVFSKVPDPSIGFVRNLLGAFLFSGDDVEKKISVLSGGEKSRVVLATLLATPLNFLVLDEPTNHLDIKSREVLLTALQEFEGTLMIVSHDRFFLRALVNRVFEVDHGQVRIYDGTYDEYRERRN